MRGYSERVWYLFLASILCFGIEPHLFAQEPLSLPEGRVGEPYEETLGVQGKGPQALKWEKIDGEIPPGITLTESGVLKGIPDAAKGESYIFRVRVTDPSSPSVTGTVWCMLRVREAALQIVLRPRSMAVQLQPKHTAAGTREPERDESRPATEWRPGYGDSSDSELGSARPRRATAANSLAPKLANATVAARRDTAPTAVPSPDEAPEAPKQTVTVRGSLVPATVGAPYGLRLGSPPEWGSVVGSGKWKQPSRIPVGLTLSEAGVFSGTPTTAGSVTLAVEFSDESGRDPIGVEYEFEVQSISVANGAPDIYDWGRVRAYFTSGILLSKDRGDFSHSDLYLGFLLDKNWLLTRKRGVSRLRVNTYFDARLTATPEATSTTTTSTTSAPATTSPDAFLSSTKSASLQGGIYVPFRITKWQFQGNTNSLFLAPIVKLGFYTAVDRRTLSAGGSATTEQEIVSPVNPDRFYKFYGFGVRLGHHKEHDSTSIAPELISHLDLVVGRFANFDLIKAGNTAAPFTTKRPYRYAVEGMLKVPSTPFVIGLSANVGQGTVQGFGPPKDDLRFLFGARFDLGKLIKKLGPLNQF